MHSSFDPDGRGWSERGHRAVPGKGSYTSLAARLNSSKPPKPQRP